MPPPNPELQLADDFVRHTDCHIFLTGKAGTGKTTFLHQLRKNTGKRLIVAAPTGVAAINAGGVTLHSFFQMPFGPFVPGSAAHDQSGQRRFNKEKISIIRSLDLLVIDEISMVRADLLDGVDTVLRRYRRSTLPFGGVQLLMIGDLQQLTPVVTDADQQILQGVYDSPYFFSSHALRQTELITIELQRVYRQSDHRFIELLNRVRDNTLDPDSLRELNSRCIPNFVPNDNDASITLGTHNRGVDAINETRMRALPGRSHRFAARVEGTFPEYAYPTAAELELKAGAQVMFVRNDPSRDKLYFNGKIGRITRITDKAVFVRCPADAEEIMVEPATWENITYTLDNQTKEITENKVGSFVQYPLKPAWAITIHKSQGLTFDKAVIDAAASFAHGQVYVALSRCRTLQGMVLSSPLSAESVKSDPAVHHFIRAATQQPPSPERLIQEKIGSQQRLLLACFDFSHLRYRVNRLVRLLLGNQRLIRVTGVRDIRQMENDAARDICQVGDSFKRQLTTLFSPDTLPETDSRVQERVNKASRYFQEKIAALLTEQLNALEVETDNVEVRKQVRDAVNELNREKEIKTAAVTSCATGFIPERYRRMIATAAVDFTPAKAKKSAPPADITADIAHPELFQALKEWRTKQGAKEGVPLYRIVHQNVLIAMAVTLPASRADLERTKGIGPRTLEKYGTELLELIAAYRRKHDIGTNDKIGPPA